MKIELNDWEDVRDFVAMMNPAYLREWNKQLGPDAATVAGRPSPVAKQVTADVLRLVRRDQPSSDVPTAAEPEGLPTDIAPPCTVGYSVTDRTFDEVQKDAEAAHASLVEPERDADGAPYDTRWHSEPKKLTDKGVFRARRGRDNDAYKAWLLEQAVEVAEAAIAADEAEPVATETHALPQDDGNEVAAEPQEPGSEPSAAPSTPASAVDLEALIAASLEAAQDASDSHVDLLNACRDFTSKHGHPAFTALKAAVAPEDAGGGGKAVQHFTPGERRLMQACIANYPSN